MPAAFLPSVSVPDLDFVPVVVLESVAAEDVSLSLANAFAGLVHLNGGGAHSNRPPPCDWRGPMRTPSGSSRRSLVRAYPAPFSPLDAADLFADTAATLCFIAPPAALRMSSRALSTAARTSARPSVIAPLTSVRAVVTF